MSALPKAVQAQIAKANKLAEDFVAAKNPPPAPPPAPVASAPQGGDPTSPPAAPPAAATPPSEPAPPVDWEHKFKVLQGKYNAEVPRLSKQVQEQEQLLRDTRQQLASTQTQLASLGTGKPANAGAPAQPPQRRVKDEEVNAFGSDLYDFIKRAAREELDGDLGAVRSLEQRLAQTEKTAKTVGDSMARSAVQQVFDLLASQVPDWEAQNVDPTFLAWLDEVDPYTGQKRGQLLSQAFEAHDGPRVVAFFKGFKNENAAVQPPSAAPAEPAATQPPAPEVQLRNLVAPGTPKAGPQGGAPSDAGKRVWSQADAQQLYRAKNEFTKKGKPIPKELIALEADLVRAPSEGRLKV